VLAPAPEPAVNIPTKPVVNPVPSGIVFQIDMPGFDLYSIQLAQKLSVIPSLFIGTYVRDCVCHCIHPLFRSSVPLDAKYVPQSVRTYLLNSSVVQELFRFEICEGTDPKAVEMVRSLAHSLTVRILLNEMWC
jgi:hypothetical protein